MNIAKSPHLSYSGWLMIGFNKVFVICVKATFMKSLALKDAGMLGGFQDKVISEIKIVTKNLQVLKERFSKLSNLSI